jgi:putative chitinase
MLYDRKKFFDAVRNTLASGTLKQEQVDGFDVLLKEAEKRGTSTEWNAYILATAWHETAFTMQPVRETLAKDDITAIARLDKAWAQGKLGQVKTPYWRKGYFGRGYIQLTWDYNYKKMGEWLGIDLLKNPALALESEIAAKILFEGMIRGMFTAKKLGDYLDGVDEYDDEDVREFTAARAVVNGKDKAKKIAEYALKIKNALKGSAVAVATVAKAVEVVPATKTKPAVVEVKKEEVAVEMPPPPTAEPKPIMKSTTIWSAISAFVASAFGILGNLNPYVQGLIIVLVFGLVAWIIWQRFKGNKDIEGLF